MVNAARRGRWQAGRWVPGPANAGRGTPPCTWVAPGSGQARRLPPARAACRKLKVPKWVRPGGGEADARLVLGRLLVLVGR